MIDDIFRKYLNFIELDSGIFLTNKVIKIRPQLKDILLFLKSETYYHVNSLFL